MKYLNKFAKIVACFIAVVSLILPMTAKAEGTFAITASTQTVDPNGTFTVSIGGNCAGRVDISVTGGTASESKIWVDESFETVTITAGSSGSVVVTATPYEGFSDLEAQLFEPGPKTVTVTIEEDDKQEGDNKEDDKNEDDKKEDDKKEDDKKEESSPNKPSDSSSSKEPIKKPSNKPETDTEQEPDQEVTQEPKKSISSAIISEIQDQIYTGSAILPKFTVTVDGVELVEGVDYEVVYENNTSVGTGKIIINGINDYEGTITKTFNIIAVKDTCIVHWVIAIVLVLAVILVCVFRKKINISIIASVIAVVISVILSFFGKCKLDWIFTCIEIVIIGILNFIMVKKYSKRN